MTILVIYRKTVRETFFIYLHLLNSLQLCLKPKVKQNIKQKNF